MLNRFMLFAALAGALFTFSLSPSFALSESQQDAAIASLQSAVASLQSTVTSQAKTIASQQTTINAQKSLLSGFSRVTDTTRTDGKKGTELFLTGFNLHIVNGLGATNGEPNAPNDTTSPVVNGLGNVVIGYNALRGNDNSGNPQDNRTGSHNLIVGDQQNYSSFGGGLVGGYFNTVSGQASSVGGGVANRATANNATVSGGGFNAASGSYSTVSGGLGRSATDLYNWSAGGYSQSQ